VACLSAGEHLREDSEGPHLSLRALEALRGQREGPTKEESMANQAITKILLGLDYRDFEKGMDKVSKKTKGLQNDFKKLHRQIGAAFAVAAIGDFTRRAVELAGAMEGVQAGFENMADPELLGQLQDATKGTVNNLELMASATKAITLGLDQANLPMYFEFARRRAKATGEEVDYLIRSIVDGLGRQSKRVIDNLGISQKAMSDEMARGLTFAEAFNKLMQEQMATLPEDTKTYREELAKLHASFENMQTTIGLGIIPYLQTMLELMNSIADIEIDDDSFLGLLKGLWNMNMYENIARENQKVFDQWDANFKKRQELFERMPSIVGAILGTQGELDKWLFALDKAKEIVGDFKAPQQQDLGVGTMIGEAYARARAQLRGLTEDAVNSMEVIGQKQEENNYSMTTYLSKWDELVVALDNIAPLLEAFAGILQRSLNAALISGENFIDTMMKGLKDLIIQLGIAAALSLLIGGVGAGIGAFGSFAGGFKTVLAALTGIKLAEGGIVTRRTPAIIGEAGPEAVIPLDKLSNIMGSGGELVARISGRDLLVLLNRESSVSRNIYGSL
jgi:hypothetical protein